MGFMDRAKATAEQAAAKARDTAEDVKTRRELGQSYDELGKLAYELVTGGELTHERLTPLVEKIKSLKAELED
jgi:hypothetical protein